MSEVDSKKESLEKRITTWLENASGEEILASWEAEKRKLAEIKEAEMFIRKYIVSDTRGLFGFDRNKLSGTERVSLDDDNELKAVKSCSYNLTNANGETDAALDNFSDDLAAMLVQWTPQLNVKNYKALTDEQQAHFADALTIKEGAPTLEIAGKKKRR